ncbi:hypothetical protein MRX96_020311 [Rhipicephalus microplus]
MSFGVSKLSFLEVVVSAEHIRRDPSKIEAVKAMQAPTDVAGVRRLLGMESQPADLAESTTRRGQSAQRSSAARDSSGTRTRYGRRVASPRRLNL